MKALLEFLESRGGVVSAVKEFGSEPTPRRGAWLFTLGSATLFALLIQLVTGLVLALHYAPTPDHAHESVRFLHLELPGGALVRGLHHWGASAAVVLAVLHLVRTFVFGSYRKPRELNWIIGVFLLLVVLGFGFTGYLLPWDQKAYWATVVGTKVPAQMPVLGPAIGRLMAGGATVGAYTLTRFYTLHVVLLPLLLAVFVGGHLKLLRKHGHAGPTTGPDPREPFFPYQVARDAVAGVVLVAALVFLALQHPAPLERVADPSDTSYVPRPEWYFLPLFQLLKLFAGPLEPIGAAVLPGLTVLLLLLVPWLDRAKDRTLVARRGILAAGGLMGAGLLVLLAFGAADHPPGAGASMAGLTVAPPDPRVLLGATSYERRGCASCHGAGGVSAPSGGIALAGRTPSRPASFLEEHVREKSPRAVRPEGFEGEWNPDKDLPALEFYSGRIAEGPVDLSKVPAAVRRGGEVIEREECRSCHVILGSGATRGPALAAFAGRRDRAWIVGHFKEPKKFVASSRMPSFKDVPEPELEAMADYLLALP